jgi:hypothetical protein
MPPGYGRLQAMTPSGLDHDLAGRQVRLHIAVRFGDLVEGEQAVHVGMVGAAVDSPDDALERLLPGGALQVDAVERRELGARRDLPTGSNASITQS